MLATRYHGWAEPGSAALDRDGNPEDGAGPCGEREAARADFLRSYPGYASTGILDELRASEYGILDRQGHVYLDYAGGGLYATSQIRRHFDLLNESVFGNPHSGNLPSRDATARVERARARVLDYFNAPPDEYFAIFTPNATGALKLVGESYPFGPKAPLLLTTDNHNSVNGIREFARARGAGFNYVPLTGPDLRIDRDAVAIGLSRSPSRAGGLFAFPAQSNFSGVQHPLGLIDEAHAAGWDVLLDAAAFVPTNRLDLVRWKPDLVAVSFHKMFGHPTGVGCLLMHREMFAKLRRPWFAGGTVRIASVQGDGHALARDATAYEDGTVNYLSMPAVEFGLEHLSKIGINIIHERVRCLTGWLLDSMGKLKHRNGIPLVRVHGPQNLEARGGVVAFNLLDEKGQRIDILDVENLANTAQISLRTGCFCNPGAGETVSGLRPEQIGAYFRDGEGMSFEELRSRVRAEQRKELGAIRASLGAATNFADVFRFRRFLLRFLNRGAANPSPSSLAP